MKDFVVYTAVTKGYDRLRDAPSLWKDEANFVAFLEKPSPALGWQFRALDRNFSDPCRNAKIYKILPHQYFPNAKYSLWIDGSVSVHSTLPLRAWVDAYLSEHDLAVFKHRCRNCVYAEAAHCIACGVDAPEIINRQMQRYRAEGYPEDHGLAECTILFRRHTGRMKAFNEIWHREIAEHSRRDQLSFNYTAHRLQFPFFYLPGNMADNPHVAWHPHTAPRTPAPLAPTPGL